MGVRWDYAAFGLVALIGCAEHTDQTPDLGEDTDVASGTSALSVHAQVIASPYRLSGELVPALTFTPYVTNAGHSEYIVPGEHSGDVLGMFSLRVSERPPEEAIAVMTQGEPALALGGITVVSPDHPSRLDWKRDDGGEMRVCSDSGECGVPSGNVCGNTANCLGTVVPGKSWGNHGVAGRYLVLYLDDAVAAGSVYSRYFAQGRALPAGYSIIRYDNVQLDPTSEAVFIACEQRAGEAALHEFNSDHGTDYTDYAEINEAGWEHDAQLLADWDGAMIAATVHQGCVLPGAQQIAPNTTADTPLRLVLERWNNL